MSQPTTRGVTRQIVGRKLAVERELARLERDQKLMGAVYVRRGNSATVVYTEVQSSNA